MLAAGDRVLVAVSGGPDSTGLLVALSALRRKLGIDLVAAHVNHRLRGEDSDRDEACAAAAAAALGVPFTRSALSLAPGGNLEARARRLRYAALRERAALHGCAKIATGHTLDDQAETVLMRLVRGSGGRGLGGIRPRRADGVVRPLIDCRRAAVAAVVVEAGLTARADASNHDPRFLRTHIRDRVLPLLAELNPAVARACANLAAAVRAERAIVASWADSRLAAGGVDGRLPLAVLTPIDPAVRPVLLRRWLVAGGVAPGRLTARHVGAVLDLAGGTRTGARVVLPGGWVARRERVALTLAQAADGGEPRVRTEENAF